MKKNTRPIILHGDSTKVNAVNALFGRLKKHWDVNSRFSAYDCGVQFKYEITCDCDNTTCWVTEIYSPSHDLRGRIPAEIGNLTNLMLLNLRYNRLSGSIPETFKNLTRLSVLVLGDNYLEGPIPLFLGELKSLQVIDLSNNGFNDSIPPGLGALPDLKRLSLYDNLLSGGIPHQLGSSSSLKELYLMDNWLSGLLPPQLGNLKDLQYMHLMNNEFSGELPPSFKELKNLTSFAIHGNNFTGTIPEYISNWTQLQMLSLMGNNFTELLPDAISTLKNLYVLEISDLTASPQGISFPNISGLNRLQRLTLRNCSLNGVIPDFIWKISSLSYLDLSFNSLIGEIPPAIEHTSLKYIFLKRNKFNGSLPQWLTYYRHLYVDVSENFFTNAIPPPAANISKNLNLFSCCSNKSELTAAWQGSDYSCQNKKMLNDHIYINCGGEQISINNSNFEADLQQEGASTFFLSENKSWAYSSMGAFIDGSRYITNRTCNLSMADAPLYMNARISPISLKYYGFCLKRDTYVVRLHFAEITWADTKVPSGKGRRVFDVEIQGEKKLRNFNITEAAGGVNKNITMEFTVNVTDSRLEIHLYWTGKGSTVAPSKYYGPLISAISVTPVPKRIPSSRKQLSVVSISGIVGSAFLFLIFVLLLFWMLGWFGANELLYVGIYDFHQIKAATNNFNDENKIGEGGFGPVYKGKLPDGTFIAVKKLSGKSKQGSREFANEISTIFHLKHEHLVGLLGSFAQDNHILLVYEYMENKSLEHALFGSEELRQRLDWPTRVKICLGIAKGLAFLHEESQEKIIHTDIKPTKILLDTNLEAKISDFGFAKLYEEGKTLGTTAGNIEGKTPGTTAVDDEGKTPGIKIPSTTAVDVEGRTPSTIAVDDEGKTPGPTTVADLEGKTLATTTLDDEGKRPGTIRVDDEEKTHVARKTKVTGGTTIYMAPEYASDGLLSYKVDVYSFGVVTLQIVSGQERVTTRTDGQRVYLIDRAGVLEQENNLVGLVDPTLGSNYNHKEAETILELAMMCINPSSSLRPIMSQVVGVLERKKDIRTLRNELGYAKVLPSLSQSSQSGSTSQEGTSVPTLSHSVSKETGEQSGISEISDIKASG